MTWIELAAGLALLFGGGEALVKGAVGLAARLGVSPLLIGLTFVGFGTSTPELVASVEAALIGAPGIAVGNIVGSNIANILLILGISAMVLPMATTKAAFRRDGAVLVGASLLLLAVVLGGTLSRAAGAVFVLLLAAFVVFTYLTERRRHDASAVMHESEAADAASPGMGVPLALVLAVGGIAAVIVGADLLVGAAIEIAAAFGLSEAVIGLTLVAVGTSLPELATSVMAALRRHGDVAFGNLVGSNIFNILGIGGAAALVSPLAIPPEVIRLDIWVMLAAAALLVAFAVTGWRVNRVEGAILLAAYAAYLAVQFSPALRAPLGLA